MSIHYFRGLAALCVLIFHATAIEGLQIGVDLFFVISGFVICSAAAKEKFDVSAFLLRRFWRVVPLWWIAMAIWLLAAATTGGPIDTGRWAANLLFFSSGEPRFVYIIGWTLQHEAFFYLVFVAAFSLSGSAGVIAALAVIPALSFTGIPVLSPYLWEFLAGAVIARNVDAIPKSAWVLAPLGLLIFVVGGFDPEAEIPHRAITWGGCAAMIVTGGLAIESRLPRLRLPFYLGSASYSIYLAHLLAVAPLKLHNTHPAILVAGGVLAGVAFYEVFERPLLRVMRRPVTTAP